MSEMQLKQTGFTYSACGPFTKNKESKSQKVMQTGDTRIKHWKLLIIQDMIVMKED